MSKRYCMFLTALFCGFLGLFLVWHLLLPDAAFSANENRYLEQLPKPSLGLSGSFFTGEFMEDFETYVNDQFPLRDEWVGLKAYSERLSGKASNNGVYFGVDGKTLLADYPEPDPAKVEKNLGYVAALGEKTDVPVYFSLIPGKSEALDMLLPAGAPVGDQRALMDRAAQTPNVTWIDLDGQNAGGWDITESYYKTDHHWTTKGAYNGYHALMAGMGLTPAAAREFTEVAGDFYGTTWSKAGAYWYPPDVMETAVSDEDVRVTSFLDGTPSQGKLYHEEKLGEKDKYSFFLGGNQPICILESEKPGAEGSLLVVRDSFSDALAPFLTQNFSSIHLLDLRYSKSSVAQYVRENHIDQVLILYSVDNFTTDSNLFPLGM